MEDAVIVASQACEPSSRAAPSGKLACTRKFDTEFAPSCMSGRPSEFVSRSGVPSVVVKLNVVPAGNVPAGKLLLGSTERLNLCVVFE